MSAVVSPLLPSAAQWRSVNPTLSFAFVPMPSSAIAVRLSGLNPDRVRSTDERRMLNGIAMTTRSAVTAGRPAKLSVYVPSAFSRTATSSWPRRICAAPMRAARPSAIWSLPPVTWYFSFDGPKIRSWPCPE